MTNEIDITFIMRHADMFPLERLSTPINVLGAGATGSQAIVQLVKLGFSRIHVWDADKVEPHNLSTTVYGRHDIGRDKVQALHDIVDRLTGGATKLAYTPRFFTEADALPMGVMVTAVDTMAARLLVHDKIRAVRAGVPVPLIVDPRSGAEEFEIHAVSPWSDAELAAWRATIKNDEDVRPLPCMASSTPYTAAFAGASVCQTIADYIRLPDAGIRRAILTRWDIRERHMSARVIRQDSIMYGEPQWEVTK